MYVPPEIKSWGLTLSSIWLRALLSGSLEIIDVLDFSLAGTDFDSFSIQSGMAWCVKSWGWMSKPTQIQKPTMQVRPLQFLQGCITLEQLDQCRLDLEFSFTFWWEIAINTWAGTRFSFPLQRYHWWSQILWFNKLSLLIVYQKIFLPWTRIQIYLACN